MCGRIDVCDCIRIEIPASYCRLRHLSLCARERTAISEKISDCQALPNLSAKLPNISHIFLIETQRPKPIVISAGSRHAVVLSLTSVSKDSAPLKYRYESHRYYESPTIAYNFRTTFQGGFRLQYSHYQFGCIVNVHGKGGSRHL